MKDTELKMLQSLSKGNPLDNVGAYKLIKSTPTQSFYSNGNSIIMAVRGMRPSVLGDVKAAASTMWNGLEDSQLYKEEEQALKEVMEQNPGFPVRGIGHSLGGAVVDTLLEKGLIQDGHAYNPAIQPKHFFNNQTRTYNPGDILYKIYGQFNPSAETTSRNPFISNPIIEHSIHSVPMEGGISPLICRMGSKKRFASLLTAMAPPHDTYIEPFAGSAAVFWYKEPVTHEYLNDLDEEMITPLKLMKKAPTDISKYPSLDTKEALTAYLKSPGKGIVNQLTKAIIWQCNGFGGVKVRSTGNVTKPTNPLNKLKHVAEYKERLKRTNLSSMDYEKLLKKHDKKNAFIFMDPPYENSEVSTEREYANKGAFDFDRFAKVVRGLKGNWMVTINDSPRIRGLFKGFHLQPVVIKPAKSGFVGAKPRNELIITNYALPGGWKEHAPSSVILKGTG